ncbi:MAG: MtrB/PioB family decaheme-associated outer membrane protein [Bacteroidota bacterium]|nr:MtrB/PioB family decaheme-associated outer membrane protein [Bacteroidota bacterium]
MNTKQFISNFTTIVSVFLIIQPLYSQQVTNAKVEFGGRQLNGTLGSSKFTEYRDMSPGLFANKFSLGFMNGENTKFFSLWGSNVGQYNQNFVAQFGERGSFKLELEWDQIPHNYTNTARTAFGGAGTGALVMPDLVQNKLRTLLTTDLNPGVSGVQFDTLAITNLVLGSVRGVDIVSRRDKGKAMFSYSPIEEIDIKLQYTNERRSGTKPLGGNFSFNPIELIEPTNYRTQEAKANLEYAIKDWNLQLGYSASVFDNNVDVLVWDNPFREIDAVGSGSRGRIDLYPNNSAQNVNVSGAGNLPFDTRLMATASYGWRRQNDKFIPFTINTAFDTVSNFPVLPAASLNGKVGTTLMNFTVVNRFFSSLWFSARYRFFDYNNETPPLIFPAYVTADNSLTRVQRRNAVIGYKKVNTSFDATLRMISDVSLKVGYEREDWDRKHRDAEKTEENIYKASLNYTLRSWFLLRTSYSLGAKKTPHYNAEELAEEMYPQGEPVGTLGQLPQLRKFDMATRDRNKANVMTQIMPFDVLSFSGSFGLTNDDFKESQYGLLSNKSNNFSIDVTFNPTYDLAIYASYTGENFNYAMKSKQRSTPAADTSGYDWSSDLKDVVQSFAGGLTWSVDPEVLDFAIDFSYSDAKGTIATSAVNPILVTSAQNYPDTRSILRQLHASVGYHLTEHFTPRLEYRFEGYTESYFNQDVMQPYMVPVDPGASGAVFLGARQPGYSAHIIYFVLSYEF